MKHDEDENTLIKEFEDNLEIDKHDLDTELVQNASIGHKIGKLLASAQAKVDALKIDIDNAEAELYIQFKENPKEDEKLSETHIKHKITASKKVMRLNSELLEAKKHLGVLVSLDKQHHGRGYDLRKLADLYSLNYYESETGGKQRRDAVEVRADKNRREAGKLRRKSRDK